MPYIKERKIGVGDDVIITKKLTSCAGTFTKGSIVKVIDTDTRGYSFEDEKGNRMVECGWDCCELACKCKECEKPYDKNEVKRILGKESMPYTLGFCSAKCYTKSVTSKKIIKIESAGKPAFCMKVAKYLSEFLNTKITFLEVSDELLLYELGMKPKNKVLSRYVVLKLEEVYEESKIRKEERKK